MKKLRLAFVVLASSAGLVRAQDDQQQQRPPTEIPDFSNLDEYIYEPKSIVTYGYRNLSGAKLKFFGSGRLATAEDPSLLFGGNVIRSYHDGSVSPDARSAGHSDPNGNPVNDPNPPGSDGIAPDGKTNTWSFQDSRQLTGDGFVAFHTYTADVVDGNIRTKDANNNFGMELAVSRDMGKIRSSRFSWQLVFGMSINDLSGKKDDTVKANITTFTDYYSLDGAVGPTAPYSAPSSTTQAVLDGAGNPVLNSDGTGQNVTLDTTVLLSNQPVYRDDGTGHVKTDSTSVNTHWKISGAYYTFRAGATLILPITTKFHATLSAGPALIYAGSNYAVTEDFQPETGALITASSNSTAYKLLPGYYADAALSYDLTERTGFYAGALIQGAGEYTQNLNSDSAHYSTKIDLGRQQGFRSGVTIRF